MEPFAGWGFGGSPEASASPAGGGLPLAPILGSLYSERDLPTSHVFNDKSHVFNGGDCYSRAVDRYLPTTAKREGW